MSATRVARGSRRTSAVTPAGILLVLCVLTAACGSGPRLRPLDAPYVPTPDAIGLEMLRLAEVTERDVVYDLGSGDGRVVIAAARHFGARGVGVELDASLVQQSNENAVKAGVADRVSFVWQDLFVSDISPATVITLYLFQEVNVRLRPKLLRELRPGTRVVSHDYGMGDWEADRVVRVRSPEAVHALHYWVVPARVEGTWRVHIEGSGAGPLLLRLRQRFQHVTGTLTADGHETPITDVTLRGDRLDFTASLDQERGHRTHFSGQVEAHAITGRVRPESGRPAAVAHWTAARVGEP